MSPPTVHATEALLKARFGPEALITQVDAIWVVHLDQPSAAELAERHAEIQREIRRRPK